LFSTLVLATECFTNVSLWNDEPALAVAMAEELLGYEPFRETGYQVLMRAHIKTGNRAESLRAYERCRQLHTDELGADPSPETQSLHLEVLTAV
jgi:DNA-binding SARP family transcriptional activator